MLTKIVIVTMAGLAGVATGDSVDLEMSYNSQGYFKLDVTEHSSAMTLLSNGGAAWISDAMRGSMVEYVGRAPDLRRANLASLMREDRVKTLRGLQLQNEEIDEDELAEDIEEEVALKGTMADKKCDECVEKETKTFVEFAVKKVEAKCKQEPDCPLVKELCALFEKNPDFLRGFLWARMQPLLIGYAYCMGSGDCKKPSVDAPIPPHFNLENIDMPVLEHMIIPGLSTPSTHESLSPVMFAKHAGLKDSEKEIEERRLQEEEDMTMEYLKDVGSTDNVLCPQPDPKCQHCIERNSKRVMRFVVEVAVVAKCRHPKDERTKKFCEWAKEHKELVFGYLLGKAEPWKFATGICLGDKECPPPRPPKFDALDV